MRARCQLNSIIHCNAKTSSANQVPLRRLHRHVPKKELNLLQFNTDLAAKTCTRAAEVVWREGQNLAVLHFLLHDTPNDLGAESGSPDPASLLDRTKERAGCNPGGRHSDVNFSFHRIRDRNGSHVAALADEIGYDPLLLPLLYVFNAQLSHPGSQVCTEQSAISGLVGQPPDGSQT